MTMMILRSEQAHELVKQLTPDPLFGALSALFFAAPRQTGKSTVLKSDLIPALKDSGRVALYVDLCEDPDVDPSIAVRRCIRAAIEANMDAIHSLQNADNSAWIRSIGYAVDLRRSLEEEATFSESLLVLTRVTDKDVVLIIDEAQRAWETDAGQSAMFALKAARDAVNQQFADGKLYLIMVGSDRAKLARIIEGHQAPFYGASVRDFPPIGKEFVEGVVANFNNAVFGADLSHDEVTEAFERLGREPGRLLVCVRALAASKAADRLSLKRIVDLDLGMADAGLTEAINGLTEIEMELVRMLVEDEAAFAPYSQRGRMRLARINKGAPLSTETIKKGLKALASKGLIPTLGQG